MSDACGANHGHRAWPAERAKRGSVVSDASGQAAFDHRQLPGRGDAGSIATAGRKRDRQRCRRHQQFAIRHALTLGKTRRERGQHGLLVSGRLHRQIKGAIDVLAAPKRQCQSEIQRRQCRMVRCKRTTACVQRTAIVLLGFRVMSKRKRGRTQALQCIAQSRAVLAIGFFATFTGTEGRVMIRPEWRLAFMTGVCGGYTTFSSFRLQTLNLSMEGDWVRPAGNGVLLVVLCLAAVLLGHLCAAAISR